MRRATLAANDSHTLLNTAPFYANARRSTSSSENLNWFALELGGASVFGGLQWSGEWALDFARTASELVVHGSVHYFSRQLAPGETLVSPRAFVGVYAGDVDSGLSEMHRYLRAHVMPPAPDARFPWTCYNTWYNWNIGLEEAALRNEARIAAELGLECFYVDAGWWEGSPPKGGFGTGLGAWTENREKFPAGLAAFADFVHGLGMKFGLWVEPERVDGGLVDRPASGLRELWLARRDGVPLRRPDNTHQLCFGNRDAVEWVKQKVARAVREYKVDWLKWDHNFYVPCNRPDHGHQPGDGGFAHIQGVYEALAHLRREFPTLAIENCSGGGNRIDFGILRFAHTTWNSDDTAPSSRVRYQTIGCSYPFPAQYQNSWYIRSREEPVTAATPARYLDYLFRSRMIGAFGISDRLGEWPAGVREAARRAIAEYKRMRPALTGGDVYHLLPQPLLTVPPLQPPEQWEAIEYFHPELDRGVVLSFRAAAPNAAQPLKLRGLKPDRRYRIGVQTRTGREWSAGGITVELPERNSSEVLWIEG